MWGRLYRDREINDSIKRQASFLKEQLYAFVERFGVEILVAENALTIPMQIPRGIALTDFIAESNMPTIAHHHDFYWERTRFAISAIRDYLEMAFPLVLPQIQHAVINSVARDQLAWRKGIEHAINVVSRLKDPRCKLIISHESGDEGDTYLLALRDAARDANVDLRLVTTVVPDVVDSTVQPLRDGSLGLWDLYGAADLVTYPSLYAGFGNALLEAFFYRVPVLINRYSIFIQDIQPKGFKTITMDGLVTPEVVGAVRRILDYHTTRTNMVNHHYDVASRYYSYSILRRRVQTRTKIDG